MPNPDRPIYSPPQSLTKNILIIILQRFFKLLYHQFAWAYDGVACIVSVGAWQKWVRSIAPIIDGPKVLEIGFGPGHLLVELSQKGVTTFGLDESQQMVNLSQRLLKNSGKQAYLIRGQAQSLPLANECMQQVVMTFPAEFILRPITLEEIHRILCKDGRVYILPLAWITGRTPWHRLAAWVNRISGEAPVWDEKTLEPLKKAGFEVIWEFRDFSTSRIVLIQLRKV